MHCALKSSELKTITFFDNSSGVDLKRYNEFILCSTISLKIISIHSSSIQFKGNELLKYIQTSIFLETGKWSCTYFANNKTVWNFPNLSHRKTHWGPGLGQVGLHLDKSFVYDPNYGCNGWLVDNILNLAFVLLTTLSTF